MRNVPELITRGNIHGHLRHVVGYGNGHWVWSNIIDPYYQHGADKDAWIAACVEKLKHVGRAAATQNRHADAARVSTQVRYGASRRGSGRGRGRSRSRSRGRICNQVRGDRKNKLTKQKVLAMGRCQLIESCGGRYCIVNAAIHLEWEQLTDEKHSLEYF